MNKTIVLRIVITAIVIGFITLPIKQVYSQGTVQPGIQNKPPEVIKGGEWADDFWIGQLQEADGIDVQVSHMFLKYREQLHWSQTWTAHFAGGEFFQTEAISDSVRLAWNDLEQNFFSTGVYTSTVFDPGKTVDWAASTWRYSGIPDGIIIDFRTGKTPLPDETWTNWQVPMGGFMEYYCAYTFGIDETQCFTNMSRIDSNPYIQYRATFSSIDPAKTISLYEMDSLYGIHYLTGSALSILIPPVDLRLWDSVFITSTIPAGSSLVIDIMAPGGMLLIHDVSNGASLEEIDQQEYPAIQLRARLTTTDESITPDVDLWGFRWLIWNRIYLPTILR